MKTCYISHSLKIKYFLENSRKLFELWTANTLCIARWSLFGLIIFSGTIEAQTMIPKLDQEGRRGDVARLAKQRAMDKFDAADENKDGKLSRQELEKHSPYLVEKFNDRDKDHDGFLSWNEYIGHDRWPRY
jgi:hypothetical protein